MTQDKVIKCSGCGIQVLEKADSCLQCGTDLWANNVKHTFMESVIVEFPEETDSLDYFDKRYNSPRRR